MSTSTATTLGRFTVDLVGLVESDIALLRHIFEFTSNTNRLRTYDLLQKSEGGQRPNIVIINADNKLAMEFWQSRADEMGGNVPTVMAAKAKPSDANYFIKTPFYPSRVLKVLDEVTVKEWRYIPELTIGSTEASDDGALSIEDVRTFAERTDARFSAHSSLIVSSSDLIGQQIQAELNMLVVESDTGESDRQAMETLSAGAGKYDTVFVHVNSAAFNGFQLCKSLKKEFAAQKVPVILLSNTPSAMEKMKAMLSGADDYVGLPVDITKFESIILRYVS